MNDNHLSGMWNEFKGELRSKWGKLTDDEVEATKGDAEAISGLVEQRYADHKEGFREEISNLLKKYSIKKDQIVNDIKENLRH